jgi:hypothetical protein
MKARAAKRKEFNTPEIAKTLQKWKKLEEEH